MKNKNKKNNDFEAIDIDNRNFSLSNEQIKIKLDQLQDLSKPFLNDFGLDAIEVSRFNMFCVLVSYITDESLLKLKMLYIEEVLKGEGLSSETKKLLLNLNAELYSSLEFIKIKAICFSLVARRNILLKYLNFSNGFIPELKIHLVNRILTHNFPFVRDVTLRNNDLKEKEELLNLPMDKAISYIEHRISGLEDLDYQHGSNISLGKIQFYKKIKKVIINKNELNALASFSKKENNTNSQNYKNQNLFKVGLLFATGKMNHFFAVTSKNQMIMKEGYSASLIVKELGVDVNHKYISASINNYTDKENGRKNVFNSFKTMTRVLEHCKLEKLEIDPYFINRLPIE